MKTKSLVCIVSLTISAVLSASEFDELKRSLDHNQQEEVAEKIHEFSQSNPGKANAAFLEGYLAFKEERWDTALEFLEKAHELELDNSIFLSKLGLALIKKADHSETFEQPALYLRGVDCFKQAETLDESNIEAQMALIGFYSNAPAMVGGSFEKAHEHANKLLNYHAEFGTQQIADLFVRQERIDEAVKQYETYLKSCSEDNRSWAYTQIEKIRESHGGSEKTNLTSEVND